MSQSPPADGDVIDSETLFRRHAAFVAGFLFRMGIRGTDVEDLVQEVFMTAHRKGGYRPGAASPTSFLARLALEARLAHRRRDRRFRSAHDGELARRSAGAPAATPEQSLSMQRTAEDLQAVLETMEPGQRAVFVLFELQGESCASIAAGLGVKLGTVYSRLHAARRAFAAGLERRS